MDRFDVPNQKRTREDTAAACQPRCVAVVECCYFTYWKFDRGCELSTHYAKKVVDEKAVSGPVPCTKKQATENVPLSIVPMLCATNKPIISFHYDLVIDKQNFISES